MVHRPVRAWLAIHVLCLDFDIASLPYYLQNALVLLKRFCFLNESTHVHDAKPIKPVGLTTAVHCHNLSPTQTIKFCLSSSLIAFLVCVYDEQSFSNDFS